MTTLTALIVHLQTIATEIAIPAAGLAYAIAGLFYYRGTVESQETARQIIINATLGLIIILLSESLVAIVTIPLCGGM